MSGGHVAQIGTAREIYDHPVDRFVADFIGQGVFLPGTLRTTDSVDTELGVIRGNRAYGWPIGSKVDVLLRPDQDCRLCRLHNFGQVRRYVLRCCRHVAGLRPGMADTS